MSKMLHADLSPAGFSIEGPSQARIECDDKGDGSCDVRYWPTEPGDYAVHVICDDEDIKDSPFMAHILPAASDVAPEKVGGDLAQRLTVTHFLVEHLVLNVLSGEMFRSRSGASGLHRQQTCRFHHRCPKCRKRRAENLCSGEEATI